MSYNNLLVSSNSDSDDSIESPDSCAEKTDKFGRVVKRSERRLARLDFEEGDDEVFVDVQDTASWTKQIDGQNLSFCGFDEPNDSLSDSSADENLSAKNVQGLPSKNSVPDKSANDLSKVRFHDENGDEELTRNVTRVEIDIVNGSGVSIERQSKTLSVKAKGAVANDSLQTDVGPAFELQSNNSDAAISVQTKVSNATRSEDTESESNCSDAGVSLKTLSSDRSDENESVQSEPEVANSLKSDDSKASLTVNLPGSVRSEDSFSADMSADMSADIRPDFGVDLLLGECESSVATEGQSIDSSEEKKSAEVESEFGVEECKGSISLILKSREGDSKTAYKVHDTEGPLFRAAAENSPEKLDSDFGNVSDFKNEMLENLSRASGEISTGNLESEAETVVRLRTEEFVRDEAIRHPATEDDAIESGGGRMGRDPQPLTDTPDMDSEARPMQAMLKIVDSPIQLTTKSLDNIFSDSEIPGTTEEVHNSKSFGIPNKKSSKNRSACSLVKHNNSVEILRTKNSDDGTETDGEIDDDDGYAGNGYGFANKSSSSLGKHRDSVELLCGKRFDSGSSIQADKLSFLHPTTDDEDEGAYQSRSGLLKIRDSVEIIGIGDDDLEIGDVTFESSFHHSPRSILKINKPRSKENAISNTRLVSWKDTTVETELESNFPDDVKEMECESSGENKRQENSSADEKIEASATPDVKKKKLSKKPPRPKVGNLIKLFSSNKKIAFVDSDSEMPPASPDKKGVDECVQNETQSESVSNEGDAQEIKKTFTFWQKVCGTAEGKQDDQSKQSAVNEQKNNLDVETIENSDAVQVDTNGLENESKCSAESEAVPKIPFKFVEKFEGAAMVPNPLFKKFPLPMENVFVKDRVSVLERSTSGEEDASQVRNLKDNS